MNKKVLIVDDDEEMCGELKEILSDEGYEVHIALDGQKGRDLMQKEMYGAVILDLKLPGLNGYEVLQITKKSSPDLKIIVLSGRPLGETILHKYPMQEQEDNILKLADVVMNKPVLIPQLIEKVREYVALSK